MKKITPLIIFSVIVLTCLLVFVACGDKADPNDPILGWYTSADGVLIRFSFVDGKLVYKLQDATNETPVTKNGNEYTVNPFVFTLTSNNEDKILTSNDNIASNNVSSKHFRYLTTTDKTYDEAKEIYNVANPYRINEPVFGWYYHEDEYWQKDSHLIHIYIHNGRIAFSYDNDDNVNYIRSYSPSTQYEGCIAYEGNTTHILYDPDYNGSKALHINNSLSLATTKNYIYVTTADKTY